MARIFVSWPDFIKQDGPVARLREAGHAIEYAPKLGARSSLELARLARGCAGAIVSTDPFTAETLASLPELQVIARVGVGTDSVDITAATRLGVAVTVTPRLNGDAVADQALAMMLALCRRIVAGHRDVTTGGWCRFGNALPNQLTGRRIGLVGGGDISARVVRRLSGFETSITYFDPAVDELPGALRIEDLDTLLAESDTVSLHLPYTAQTAGLICAQRLSRMRPTAHLINTARGGIVDENALFDALRGGRLGGAALDVFATEPPDAELMADIPNLICSAHVGGLSHNSVASMTVSAADSVCRVLAGERSSTVINREVYGFSQARE